MPDSAEEEKQDKFRKELAAEFGRLIAERFPNLAIPMDLVQQRVYTKLRLEMSEYDLTQRSPRKELNEIRDEILASAGGVIARFGEAIDDLVRDERDRRRVINAAIQAAADVELELIEIREQGADWDPTASIERGTTRVIRRHARQHQVFLWTSMAGIAALIVVACLSLISWIVAAIIGACWVVGVGSGTRFVDIHDHS